MRRFRVRRFGSEDWSILEVRGDTVEEVGPILETALKQWSAVYHVQEWNGSKWEDCE